MLSNQQKRELANKLIVWLKETKRDNWLNSNVMIREAAKCLKEHPYEVWKIHDLLRTLGRIELNSPNGRKGGRLVNDTPVELPLQVTKKCEAKNCPIVKAMFRTFPDLYNSKEIVGG